MAEQKDIESKPFGFTVRGFRGQFSQLIEQQKQEIIKDPHGFSLGCSVGLAVNFFPTMGVGFLVAFFLASLLRANKASAAATSLITGPLIPIKYSLNLLVGGLIQAGETDGFFEFVVRQYAQIARISSIREQLLGFLDFFGTAFIIGAVINAVVFGVALYFLTRHLLIAKQSKRT